MLTTLNSFIVIRSSKLELLITRTRLKTHTILAHTEIDLESPLNAETKLLLKLAKQSHLYVLLPSTQYQSTTLPLPPTKHYKQACEMLTWQLAEAFDIDPYQTTLGFVSTAQAEVIDVVYCDNTHIQQQQQRLHQLGLQAAVVLPEAYMLLAINHTQEGSARIRLFAQQSHTGLLLTLIDDHNAITTLTLALNPETQTVDASTLLPLQQLCASLGIQYIDLLYCDRTTTAYLPNVLTETFSIKATASLDQACSAHFTKMAPSTISAPLLAAASYLNLPRNQQLKISAPSRTAQRWKGYLSALVITLSLLFLAQSTWQWLGADATTTKLKRQLQHTQLSTQQYQQKIISYLDQHPSAIGAVNGTWEQLKTPLVDIISPLSDEAFPGSWLDQIDINRTLNQATLLGQTHDMATAIALFNHIKTRTNFLGITTRFQRESPPTVIQSKMIDRNMVRSHLFRTLLQQKTQQKSIQKTAAATTSDTTGVYFIFSNMEASPQKSLRKR